MITRNNSKTLSYSILSPQSIAIIGASDKEGSVGHAITSNIIKDFKGSVFSIFFYMNWNATSCTTNFEVVTY